MSCVLYYIILFIYIKSYISIILIGYFINLQIIIYLLNEFDKSFNETSLFVNILVNSNHYLYQNIVLLKIYAIKVKN